MTDTSHDDQRSEGDDHARLRRELDQLHARSGQVVENRQYRDDMTQPASPQWVRVTRPQSILAWTDVRCGRCRCDLQPVFDDNVIDGVWDNLVAKDALRLLVPDSGYGSYFDTSFSYQPQPLLLCKTCADWAVEQIPALAEIINQNQ